MVGEDHNPLHPHCWDAQEKARKQALKTTPRRNNNPVPAVLRKPGSTFFDGVWIQVDGLGGGEGVEQGVEGMTTGVARWCPLGASGPAPDSLGSGRGFGLGRPRGLDEG